MGIMVETREVELENGEKKKVSFMGQPHATVAVMTGFDISFSDEDHHVRGINVGVKIIAHLHDGIEVEGTAEVWDDDANHASGTVKAILIANMSQ